jgi:aspartate racemase
MKTIGLLGGMSWESTELYYRLINEQTRTLMGGLHSAPLVMVSVDFQEIEQLQNDGRWRQAGELLAGKAQAVEAAGADFLVICTNTMHRVAEQIQAAINIPLLHLADATASEIVRDGFLNVALLGTRFTMEQDFYKGRLEEHGLNVLVPEPDDRDTVHRIIYDELCLGKVEDASRQQYLAVIDRLADAGADCVIAGCTEIGMLVKQPDIELKLFDTTEIHALAAVAKAMQ